MPLAFSSIELEWPEDAAARAQMEEFHAELEDCSSVNEAFLDALGLDYTGDDEPRRPDLLKRAEARIRAWGTEGDAVERASEFFEWLCREVLGPHFEALRLPRVETFFEASKLGNELGDRMTEARTVWGEAYRRNEADAEEEWAWFQILEETARAAKSLSFVPRRANVAKFKPRLNRGSRPIDVCESVAGSCAEVYLYASEMKPFAANAVDLLGHPASSSGGPARRGREALHAAGITEFGTGLEALALEVVDAYDRTLAETGVGREALNAGADVAVPRASDAVALLIESPQLAARPIPADAVTFAAAAEDVLVRAVAQVAAVLHAQSPRDRGT